MSEKHGDGESKAKRKPAKSAKSAKTSAKAASAKPRAKRATAKTRRARGTEEESPVTLRESPRALAQPVRDLDDEISIPPASSDEIDEGDERFFQAGEAAAHEPLLRTPSTPLAVEITEQRRFVNPSFRERQQKLQRYVKVAVGFSAAVCLAALVRIGVEHVGHSAGESTAAAAEGPSVAMIAGERAPAPSLAPQQQVVVQAPAAAVAPVAAPVAADPAAVPTKSAADEKKDARSALERFKLADAIAAGERAVAADPTDAEAWLILGAAYQESGKRADAHRAFDTCVHAAKRGPVNECVALR